VRSFGEIGGGLMGLNPESRARFNLERATILIFDEQQMGMNILIQILTGFGAKAIHRAETIEQAHHIFNTTDLDLILVDATGADSQGYEFVRWLRKSGIDPNCFAPVLITSGHTPNSIVSSARDCGAHFILAKPLTPIKVLERILWIAREGRKFIECDSYVGPDRRFKNEGIPAGLEGRRRDDAITEVSDSAGPNMDQELIDNLVKTRRAEL